ncbi:Protein CBG16048 [Caenorhabditis briggsae]|uniref:Protein CBG16048 n=1 Tax=Caenorhabditis briggsae TaxID=6238 RepID=B0K096_CAEBR|nr:Protein CBG16048 [Caenorhabditis briggsae]CAP34306.4 Protein CBG16048 [Caenorhabditis briggsae]
MTELLINKYAVKQTIIHQRQEKSTGDPWDEFFYRIYSAEKPRVDSTRQSRSAEVKLNLNKELQDKLTVTDYDSSVKDKLTPYKSSSSDRGKRAFDNLSRVSSKLSKQRQQEISEEGGPEHLCQHATLPKLPPIPRRRETERTDERGRRFRVEKVRAIFGSVCICVLVVSIALKSDNFLFLSISLHFSPIVIRKQWGSGIKKDDETRR